MGDVVRRAHERLDKGTADKHYVLLLAHEIEKQRDMLKKLGAENAMLGYKITRLLEEQR